MDTLISKILNYEQTIFDEYTAKRKKLIKNIKEKEKLDLNKNQILIFINDLKSIFDSIKSGTEYIDYYFTNLELKKNNTLNENEQIKLLYLLLILDNRFGINSSLETLETLETDDSLSSLSSDTEVSDVDSLK